MFHGAYTLALAEGQGVLDAARFASAAAALKCRNGTGWAASPTRAEVLTLMAEPALGLTDVPALPRQRGAMRMAPSRRTHSPLK